MGFKNTFIYFIVRIKNSNKMEGDHVQKSFQNLGGNIETRIIGNNVKYDSIITKSLAFYYGINNGK